MYLYMCRVISRCVYSSSLFVLYLDTGGLETSARQELFVSHFFAGKLVDFFSFFFFLSRRRRGGGGGGGMMVQHFDVYP